MSLRVGAATSADGAVSQLLAWLWNPDRRAGVSFMDSRGQRESLTYDELSTRVFAAADRLRDVAGLRAGGRVLLLMETGPAYVTTLYAVLQAGGVVVPAYPPRTAERRATFLHRVEGILARAEPEVLVVDDRWLESLEMLPAGGRPQVLPASSIARPSAAAAGRPPAVARPRTEPAIVQFTSGSTSDPRGVLLYEEQLLASLGAMAARFRRQDGDRVVSWLPLYHDMGLIGGLMLPVAEQTDLVVMTPATFILRPHLWLDCLGRHGGTVGGLTPSAVEHVLKRVRPGPELDLSGTRALVIGAEPVNADALRALVRTFGPRGLRARVLCPAYGLAEATLAVTAGDPEEEPRVVQGRGDRAASRPLMDGRDEAADRELVALGKPLDGMAVEIRTPDGRPLAPGMAGDVWAWGPSVSPGYLDDPDATSRVFHDGWCRTGDAGMLVDGQLVFLGRGTDRLSAQGNNYYAEDFEAALFAVEGLAVGSTAVVLDTSGSESRVTVLWEARQRQQEAVAVATEVMGRLAGLAGRAVEVRVLAVERGAIPRTTSGKVRRQAAAAGLAAGRIPGRVLVSSR